MPIKIVLTTPLRWQIGDGNVRGYKDRGGKRQQCRCLPAADCLTEDGDVVRVMLVVDIPRALESLRMVGNDGRNNHRLKSGLK